MLYHATLVLVFIKLAVGLVVNDVKPQRVMCAAHHKCGTKLGFDLEACFVGDGLAKSSLRYFPARCIDHRTLEYLAWNGSVPDKCDHVAHFIRDPIDIIRSAYLYHKQTPPPPQEAWLRWSVKLVLDSPIPGFDFQPGETYHHYTNRLPEDLGLLAEMFGRSKIVLANIEDAYVKTLSDPRVLVFCLEEGWEDYAGMLAKMSQHFQVPLFGSVQECAMASDPSRQSGTHITANSLASSDMNRLLSTIRDLDKTWFGGKFGSSIIAKRCSRHSAIRGSTSAAENNKTDFFSWADMVG